MSEVSEVKEKKTAGCLSEFIFFLIALVVFLGSAALIVMGYFSGKKPIALAGIGVTLAFALIVFIIPYFRRNSYIKWLAVSAIGDAAWWAYMLFTD